MSNPNPQQKRKGVSLTGPLYLKRKPDDHRSTQAGRHVSALTPMVFTNTAVLTKNTDITLALGGASTDPPVYIAPFAGSIVAMSYAFNAPLTVADSRVTITAKKNGVALTGTFTKLDLTSASATFATYVQTDLTSYTFEAGDTFSITMNAPDTALSDTDAVAVTLWTT